MPPSSRLRGSSRSPVSVSTLPPCALLALVPLLGLGTSCASRAGVAQPGATASPPSTSVPLSPREARFLGDLRQLTFGGENAEAYWSFDGRELSFQARKPDEGCDRIYRMEPGSVAGPVRVSSGEGATTCAHFLPGGELIYASTHLAGAACPPKPDFSRGYVWALHPSYDIFRAAGAGGKPTRLTESPGYDAEGTVCAKDGSILFTSVRDGDLELYRMDRDGKNVRRLTRAPGYDGGAFFNADCTKIVWRASRPRGAALDEYRALLAQNLVRPSKLELWIADADGSNAMQLTYLDAASFAPSFHPTQPFVVFSSNYGDPRGREFDLWAIGLDGAHLVRLTDTPGFEGFPHFSPDGTRLAFSSNRATAAGSHDTNVFVARWTGTWPPKPVEADGPPTARAADRIAEQAAWLASPEREGRGPGTGGLGAAGARLEEALRAFGFEPAGDGESFRQGFSLPIGVKSTEATRLAIDGRPLAREAFVPLGFSASGTVEGPAVLAGYGIVDAEHKLDDYAGRDVRGKVVVVRRFAPEGATADPGTKRRLGDLRHKAFLARERGARALVVVDWPVEGAAPEADLPATRPEGLGDAGLPVVVVKREALAPVTDRLTAGRPVRLAVTVALERIEQPAFNVVGKLRAASPAAAGPLLIGAHYDHLGFGGRASLAPGVHAPHVGADDNASGTSTVLEIARALAARKTELRRDVYVAFFSGEELGLLGSTYFVRTRGDLVKSLGAMLNLDMVGRLRDNRVQVLGGDTADEWRGLLEPTCAAERIECAASAGGYGPSDQAAFYPAGVPVLHFFTGPHGDYHKPSDTADKLNTAGAAAIARVVERLVLALGDAPKLTYRKVGDPGPGGGDARSFNASLGTIPDYAGPPQGEKGVLLAGVRPGGAAERGGLRRGDLIVRLGGHELAGVEDLMYVLQAARPGDKAVAVIVREGKRLELPVTYDEGRKPSATTEKAHGTTAPAK